MKIAVTLGTRPEIIKQSPVIRECEKQNLEYFILHTGQHYSYNMDKVFFEELNLPKAKYNLDVGSGSHGKQTGQMIAGIEKILQEEKPDIVLTQGDTNSTLASALAAVKLGIKTAHIEAGLRSYDRTMPEEINRILTDHCVDYLFPPTEKSKQILLHEGIPEKQVFMVGNTVVDAVYQNLEIAKTKSSILNQMNLKSRQYIIATAHRQENVDNKTRFKGIIDGLKKVQNEFQVPLIYPIHPRAKKQLEKFNIDTSSLTLIDPLDYLSFLILESKAQLILTDSGGLQEESCILSVPCITLRDNTERPETLDVNANVLAGTDSNKILTLAKISCNKNRKWINPFGDGKAGQKIINTIQDKLTIP